MKKEFIKYVVPSMIAYLFSGIYVSIDGLFIGQSVGDIGLASINMAWPLTAIILAIGTGIGMGGAINLSNYMGATEKEKADKALGNTITLLLIFSAILTIFLPLCAKPILKVLGANGQILELAYDYVRILGLGSILQVLGVGIMPLLRNQNKSWLAMVFMLMNFVFDTVLSGVFVIVLGYGVVGAALATLVGQSIALIPTLFILFRKENRVPTASYFLDSKIVQSIIKVGISPFALYLLVPLTIVLMNWQALSYGGTSAVAAYAVISYVLSVGQLLLQGVGDGSQPLISFHYGANNNIAVKQVKRWTYFTSIATGAVITLGIIAFNNTIPVLFGVSKETTEILLYALPVCAISLLFNAFSRSTSAYFYAIKEVRNASFMVYGEALIVLPICVLLLPKLLGVTGVWVAVTALQIILFFIALILLKRVSIKTSPN
ncbi:MATE family efflux transporter [Lacrimispora brassicae]